MTSSGSHIHTIPIAKIIKQFGSSTSSGLSLKLAKERLFEIGKNELPKDSAALAYWALFFRQWKSPLLYLLLFAAAVSFLLGETVDATVVFFTAVINAIVGFFQEAKASSALKELASYAPAYTAVKRGGNEIEILNSEIVPGDIVVLREGDAVPADGRIVFVADFFVSEAALTGESRHIGKSTRALHKQTPLADRKNMVFAGTEVTRGHAEAIIVATGSQTELGKIASLVKETKDTSTPLQEQIKKLGHFVMLIVGASAVAIFVVGLLQGRTLVEVFLVAVAVGVAAIPEGLVISLTVILTVGMRRILARQAITRKLIAAETLGSISVMCVDKTGTITEGRMTVSESDTAPQVFGEKEKVKTRELMFAAVTLCSDAEVVMDKETGDVGYRGEATEIALLQAASKNQISKKSLLRSRPRIDTIAFDSSRKYMATLHTSRGKNQLYVKGAPEVVLNMCSSREANRGSKHITKAAREVIDLHIERMTSRGLRVMAVAHAEISKSKKKLNSKEMPHLTFVGLIGMTDPVRSEVPKVIEKAKRAGVRTIMITGDHALTATSVAKTIGLSAREDEIITGKQLEHISDAKLKRIMADATVFARVEPKHKIRIVHALQARGEVVAMTGDGVNDAPAIKAADIGIAVGSGTDVAKSVADVVLLDDNASTIVAAIEQGRIIFANIKKVVLYLFSNMFTEALLVIGSLVFFLPLPITAVQILWINFVTDGLPDVALAWDPGDRNAMKRPPRKRHTKIIDKEMRVIMFIISIVADVLLFLFFVSLQGTSLALEHIQTLMFLAVGLGTLLYVYSIRDLKRPVWKTDPFQNKVLVVAQILGVGLLVASVYVPFLQKFLGTVPISGLEWIVVLLIAAIKLTLIETVKWVFVKLNARSIAQVRT